MTRCLLTVSCLLFSFLPLDSSACGSTAQHFWSYTLEADRVRLQTFLESESCASEAEYSPIRAEPYIAIVLINAIDAGVDRETIEAVFERYNCVSSVRNRTAYQRIVEYLGDDRYAEICDVEAFRKMYVVASDGGANIRKEPSTDAQKVGVKAEGTLVRNGEKRGDWFFVDTDKGPGYMHSSTLTPYIPDED